MKCTGGVGWSEKIYSTHSSFAAVLKDGSVVTWGDRDYGGGDSRSVQAALIGVEKNIFFS